MKYLTILKDNKVIATYGSRDIENPELEYPDCDILYTDTHIPEVTYSVNNEGLETPQQNEYILTEDDKLNTLRFIRNKKLTETDWAVLPDALLSETERQSMLEYRQSLRDITEPIKTGELTVEEITLPTKPKIEDISIESLTIKGR